MLSSSNQLGSRSAERVFLLLITVVMVALFTKLFMVQRADFAEVPKRMKDGTIMNLNDEKTGEHIKVLLQKGFYFNDPADIEYISKVVAEGRRKEIEQIDNIGELNKNKYSVNTEEANRLGGEVFKKRVKVERSLIGFTDDDSSLFETERRRPMQVSSVNNLAMGNHAINGSILTKYERPVGGVLVRLQVIL